MMEMLCNYEINHFALVFPQCVGAFVLADSHVLVLSVIKYDHLV